MKNVSNIEQQRVTLDELIPSPFSDCIPATPHNRTAPINVNWEVQLVPTSGFHLGSATNDAPTVRQRVQLCLINCNWLWQLFAVNNFARFTESVALYIQSRWEHWKAMDGYTDTQSTSKAARQVLKNGPRAPPKTNNRMPYKWRNSQRVGNI